MTFDPSIKAVRLRLEVEKHDGAVETLSVPGWLIAQAEAGTILPADDLIFHLQRNVVALVGMLNQE